jgi:hypothetical protein
MSRNEEEISLVVVVSVVVELLLDDIQCFVDVRV